MFRKGFLRHVGLCSAVAVTLYLVVCCVAAGASGSPTADFVAAALQNQEASCGESLDVRYIMTVPKKGTEGIEQNVRYVRTPAVLFSERTHEGVFTVESLV